MRNSGNNSLREWSKRSDPPGSVQDGLVAWPTWRNDPQLTAAFPSVLALAMTPQTTGKEALAPGLATFRQELARTIISALWRHVEAAPTTGQERDATPADTAAHAKQVAIEVTTQAPSTGGTPDLYHGSGVVLTSAVASAFMEQTLHAVQAYAPGLAAAVEQERANTWQATEPRRSSLHQRSLRSAWERLMRRFVENVTTAAGPQVWTHLRNWLTPTPPAEPSAQQPAQAGAPGQDNTWWQRMLP